jgi:hypothetical protein
LRLTIFGEATGRQARVFEERFAREARGALRYASKMREVLEHDLARALCVVDLPREWIAYFEEKLAEMKRRILELADQHRRGELTTSDVQRIVAAEFDLDRLSLPHLDALSPPSSAPPSHG